MKNFLSSVKKHLFFSGLLLLVCPLINGMDHGKDASDDMLVEQVDRMRVLQIMEERAPQRTELSLKDLIDCDLISEKVLNNEVQLRILIIQLVVTHQDTFLEVILNALRKFEQCLNYSFIVHDQLVAVVSRLIQLKPQDCIQRYFATLQDGTLKMVVRLLYAIQHGQDLDQYRCVEFFSQQMVQTRCLFMCPFQLPTDPTLSYMSWHVRVSSNLLQDQAMIPVVYSLLQPILKRLYFGVVGDILRDIPFVSIDVVSKEEEPWLYLLPEWVKRESTKYQFNNWTLGPIKMLDESCIDPTLFDSFS